MKDEKSNLEYLKKDNKAKRAVILLHGFGASMQDLFGLSEVIKTKSSLDWFFPNGPMQVNLGYGMVGRAWFPVDMAALDQAMRSGVPRDFSNNYTSEFESALLKAEQFFDSIANGYDEVIVGGFSQGAMVSSHLSLMNHHKIKGLICFSGTLLGKDKLVERLKGSQKIPFLQSHGISDPVLGLEMAKNQFKLFSEYGFKGEFIEFDGAHEIPFSVIEKTQEFINKIF